MITEPGDFKTTFLGDTPVVVTRNKDAAPHAFVNRCAHRGALVCRAMRGNRLPYQCVYHQFTYDPSGELIGVPFRNGINGEGGYDDTFDPAERSPRKLQIAEYRGLFFACADPSVEPLLAYLIVKNRRSGGDERLQRRGPAYVSSRNEASRRVDPRGA